MDNVRNIHDVRNTYMTQSPAPFTDLERLKKFLELLPERQFSDFLGELDRAECSRSYCDMINEELNYSNEVFAQFDDETINNKYALFNKTLSATASFVLHHFFHVLNSAHYALHPGMKYSDDKRKAKIWEGQKRRLDDLASRVTETYYDFIKTAKAKIIFSVTLPSGEATKIPSENKKFIDDLETTKADVAGLKAIEASRRTGALLEVTAGPLSYKSGRVYFDGELVEMRPQLNMLCYLFMCNHKKIVEYCSIEEQIVASSKRTVRKKKNIHKYVSELHSLLRKRFRRNVIFNHKKEGYILDTDKDS